MSSWASQRWALAVGFAVAAGYATVALVLAVGTNPGEAVPFAYTAGSIAGPLAVATALLRSSRSDDADGDDPRDDGPGPHDDGGDDPPPPWWPEFEREFHAHVERDAARQGSDDRPVLPA